MSDCILDSLKKGHLVIWEEIARDGAQAKTLLSGTDRVTTARMMGDLFHDSGPDHLVFAAGYPSIGKEEFEAVALVADQVDNCSLATHGRMLRHDIDLGIQTMSRAAFGRASFVVPISEKYSRIILHQSAEKTLQQGIDLARYALDNARGLPVDTALGGASIAEPSFLSDAANAFFEEGIATVKLCDTVGHMYPLEMDNHIQKIINGCAGRSNQLGVHLHNDLGFALASSMNAVSKGIRMVCTSWFGIAERIGLAPTELMLFVLALPKDQLTKRTGIAGPLWEKFPNLPRIKDISSFLSEALNYPLRSTDPVISPAINDISTGAYFNNPKTFKPFDPEAIIGVPPKLVLTHLANKKIIQMVANEFGIELDAEKLNTAMAWVKHFAYKNNISEVPKNEFKRFLDEQPDD